MVSALAAALWTLCFLPCYVLLEVLLRLFIEWAFFPKDFFD